MLAWFAASDLTLIIWAEPVVSFAHEGMRPSGLATAHGVVPWDAGE